MYLRGVKSIGTMVRFVRTPSLSNKLDDSLTKTLKAWTTSTTPSTSTEKQKQGKQKTNP
jgi:hypothetical protein